MKKWNYVFDCPDQKKVRMIVYTDCKNEADDQFALAHHLMTPKFIIKGIIGGHFNMAAGYRNLEGKSADASVQEIEKVLSLMGCSGDYIVKKGAEYPLEDEFTPRDSDGARLIIEEAMKDDPHPLFIACQGSITDLASAIILEPRICERMTAIWIGGGEYPEGGEEFNQDQDISAANVVLKSNMPLWQVPKNVYKQVSVTLAELQANVYPCGEIGKYLVEQMVELNNACADIPTWPNGEMWGLGDSPTIGLLLEEVEKTDIYDMVPAPEIDYDTHKYIHKKNNRKIRVYNQVNARLILGDMFAKLKINFGNDNNDPNDRQGYRI